MTTNGSRNVRLNWHRSVPQEVSNIVRLGHPGHCPQLVHVGYPAMPPAAAQLLVAVERYYKVVCDVCENCAVYLSKYLGMGKFLF